MCEKAFSINVFSSFKIKTLVFYTTITQHNIIWSWSVKFEKQTTNYDFGIGSLYFLRSNLSRENEISYGKMRPVFIGRSLDETFSVSRLFVFPRGIQRGVAPLMQGWKKNTGAYRNKDVRPEETFQNGNRPWDCRSPIQNTPQKALYQQQCFCSTEIQVARKSVCVWNSSLWQSEQRKSALTCFLRARGVRRFHHDSIFRLQAVREEWQNNTEVTTTRNIVKSHKILVDCSKGPEQAAGQ